MVRCSRAQISFEYLIIVGLAILIIVPALFFFLSFTSGGEDAVTHSRVGEIGTEMIRSTNDVYALGRHSWLTLDLILPEEIESISMYSGDDSNEYVITYLTSHGSSSAVFYSSTPLNVQGSQDIVSDRVGQVSLRFTSCGTNVSVRLTGSGAGSGGC